MSAVTKVHQGEETIQSGDGASGEIVVGLSSGITFANCSIDASSRINDTSSRAFRHLFRLELGTSGSNTVINWTRNTGADAADVVLNWYVIEWDSASLGTDGIERGTHTKATDDTSDTVALTGTFAPANSLLFVSSETTDFDYPQQSNGTGASHIVAFDGTGANVVITCEGNPGTGDIEVSWEAVELKSADLSAQHGSTSFTDSGTQSITSVTTLADCVMLCTGAFGGNSSAARWVSRGEMDSASQISFDTSTIGSPVQATFGWTVAEWLSSVTVSRGVHTVPANDGAETVSLSGAPLTRDRTAAMMGHSWWPNAYATSTDTDSNTKHDAFYTRGLDGTTTTSNLEIDRYFNASSQAFEVHYNVVEFPAAGAGVTVTAPDATLGYTCQVPTVATGVGVTAPDATLGYTFHVPTVTADFNTTITIPAAATVGYTCQVPTVATGVGIQAPDATLGYTCQVPTITASFDKLINAPDAALGYTCQVPTVATGVGITCPAALLKYQCRVPGGTIGTVVSAGGGASMTLAQMKRRERQQLLAMLRRDDEEILALLAAIRRRDAP